MQKLRLKVVIVGERGVGKTSIAMRFSKDEFPDNPEPTRKPKLYLAQRVYDETLVEWVVWELPTDMDPGMRLPYYTGADGAVLVLDVTKPETLYTSLRWVHEFCEACRSQGIVRPMVVVANKVDRILEDPRMMHVVSGAKRFANGCAVKYAMPIIFVEASAKTAQGVDEIFERLMRACLKLRKS